MSIAPPRRPRFLSSVPAEPRPEAPQFGPAAARPRREPLLDAPREGQTAQGEAEAASRRLAMERVAAAVDTLRAQSAHVAEQARADALELGFLVARKILETELRQSQEPLFALVKSAVRRAGDSRRIQVRVSPEDAARLQGEAGSAALEAVSAARIEVFPDPALRPGDCLVETDYGQIDGRLETRLGELRRAVDSSAEGAA